MLKNSNKQILKTPNLVKYAYALWSIVLTVFKLDEEGRVSWDQLNSIFYNCYVLSYLMTECKKEFYITNNIISDNQIFLSYDFKKTKSSNDTRFNCICVRTI